MSTMQLLRGDGPVLRIGHRGAKALAPENTLASFRAAIDVGVDLVEFDALALVDGTLVVSHSDDLAELTHGAARGRVGARALEELRPLAPDLPTLAEALAFFASEARETGLHVDLKSPGHEAALLEALRGHGLLSRTLVTSPVPEPLRVLRRLEPALTIGLGYPHDRFGLSRRRALAPVTLAAAAALRATLPFRIAGLLASAGASVASLHYVVATRAAVSRAHAAGAAVIAWTANDRRTMEALARAGVDGIVTDDPRLFADTLTT
jgi:glycerophosphoryl diester phosphodiesterase